MDDPDASTLYTFSASAPMQPHGEVTYLYFAAPVAPDVVLDALPTISRQFYSDGLNVKNENFNEAIDVEEDACGLPPPDRLREARARSASVASTAPFTSPPPPSRSASVTSTKEGMTRTPTPSLGRSPGPSTRTATPTGSSTRGPPSDFEAYLPPRILTRSQSRSSLRNASAGPSTARSSPAPHSTVSSTTQTRPARGTVVTPVSSVGDLGYSAFLASLRYAATAPVVEVRYRRQKRQCHPTREEQEKGLSYKTFWFECWGDENIANPPPDIADHRELTIGDLFCYWMPVSLDPTMWLWSFGRDGRPHWLPVLQGHVRIEDDRKLTLTESHKPSWAKDERYRKRLLQQEQERRQMERQNGKGKGRGYIPGELW
ncbi:hypothetical protein L226DRAFT_573255 [Lentinus tigrinus ALCF2SS1-7]|uniref:Uncharacterized protein n=1 Tax=Lentinus tigrinus ALCF2SS1-6 TaxID=1328759 RepID=A0A5C2S3R8_9APHY|nr:hypothetical protein L227DRAFT_613188 [Lentinus tigrinus ALCF2SS1-6]RPD72187.1 hypothetical protein L226DRAFT_573255 [Lentinus tigrinus ALCF2SS1-7]